jgi:hypothetical protein
MKDRQILISKLFTLNHFNAHTLKAFSKRLQYTLPVVSLGYSPLSPTFGFDAINADSEMYDCPFFLLTMNTAEDVGGFFKSNPGIVQRSLGYFAVVLRKVCLKNG